MADTNVNARLEAFCDGVFAIALTLLIIEVHIPASAQIGTTQDLWRALAHITPLIFAFLLSFAIILITWVNHHATIRLVNKSSHPFMFANGLLLLTVVFIPFPTALLGEYLLTDHAAPAVVLYSAVCAFQAVGWNLLTRTALTLTRNDRSTLVMRAKLSYSYFAFALYGACTIVAFWLPRTVAVVVGITWIVWLIVAIRSKDD